MSAPASEDERLSDGASYGTEQCDELDNRFAANRVQNNSGVNELVSVFRQGARRTSRTLVELQAKAASYARVVPRNLAVSNPPLPSSRMRDITLDDVACLEDMECLEELTRLAHGAAIAEIDAAVPRQVPAPGRIAIRHSQSAPGSRMASPRRQRRRTRSKELAPAVESAAREVGRASTPPPSGAKQAMQSPVSYTPVLQLQVGGVTQPDGRSSAPLPSNRPGSPFQPVETGAINAHNADSAASSVAGLAAESESFSGFFGECDARQVAWESLLQREYVGSGEFCEVWGAKLDGAAVAVKLLKEEHCGKELAVKDLESEAQIMMRLRHPGCLRVLGVGSTDSGKPFLVLDRLKETLSTTLPKAPGQGSIFKRRAAVKRWPLVRALQVGLELAEALRYCHDDAVRGFRLLHRDLKPDNLGFTVDGQLVLFDFGLAKLWRIEADEPRGEGRQLTGQTGSARYMAPEVAACQPYGASAEVYSFCIILWQLLSHERPYAGLDMKGFQRQVVHRGQRPPLKKSWPPQLSAMLADGWHADPCVRPTMAEVCCKLQELIEASTTPRSLRAGSSRQATPNATPVATPRGVGVECD